MSDRDEFEKAYDSGKIHKISRDSEVVFEDFYKHVAWSAWQAARQGGEAEPVECRFCIHREWVEGEGMTLDCPIHGDHPPAPIQGVPEVCDGKEQVAFEEYAKRKGYDLSQHPLHYLFINDKTNAARRAWKAAISYCHEMTAVPNHPSGEWVRRSEIRDRLFSGWQGCSNHDCIITGPKKGMGTNGSCGCLHNASRTQLSILKARIQSMMEPPKDKQEGA